MESLGLRVERGGGIPVGTQLTWQIQALITEGRLQPGEQLPSVRALARNAGVNVNTIRSVYERLEGDGFIRTEHGRGSFVAQNVPRLGPDATPVRVYASDRNALREQISELEARLTALGAPAAVEARRRGGPRLLPTQELASIRDELAGRLEELDRMREDLVDVLASVRTAIGDELSASPARTPSGADARRATRRRLSPAPKPSGSP